MSHQEGEGVELQATKLPKGMSVCLMDFGHFYMRMVKMFLSSIELNFFIVIVTSTMKLSAVISVQIELDK